MKQVSPASSLSSLVLLALPLSAHATLIGFNAEDGSSVSTTAAVSLGTDFDSPQSDPKALGGQFITIEGTSSGDNPGGDARVATYTIHFPETGTYDLYLRFLIHGVSAKDLGDGTDDSFFYGNGFGDKSSTTDADWIQANRLFDYEQGANSTAEKYFWVNLSKFTWEFEGFHSGTTFTVNTPGNYTFEIGGREDGLWIDAFAFGTSGEAFSDEELDKVSIPEPSTHALIAGGLALGAILRRRLKQDALV